MVTRKRNRSPKRRVVRRSRSRTRSRTRSPRRVVRRRTVRRSRSRTRSRTRSRRTRSPRRVVRRRTVRRSRSRSRSPVKYATAASPPMIKSINVPRPSAPVIEPIVAPTPSAPVIEPIIAPRPSAPIMNIVPVIGSETVPVKDFNLNINYRIRSSGSIRLIATVNYIGVDNEIRQFLFDRLHRTTRLIYIKLTINDYLGYRRTDRINYKHYLDYFYNDLAALRPLPNKLSILFKGLAHTILCYLIQFSSFHTKINSNDIILLQAAGSLPGRSRQGLYAMYEGLGFKYHLYTPEEEYSRGTFLYGSIKDVEDVCNQKNVKPFIESTFNVRLIQEQN